MYDLIYMGGYGSYVWPGYLVTLGLLYAIHYFSKRSHTRTEKELALFYRQTDKNTS